MNVKRRVLLFNIFFLLLLIAATVLFQWKPLVAGPGFRPINILADVVKDSVRIKSKLPVNKTNISGNKNVAGNPIQKDYTTYQGLINTAATPTALYNFYSSLDALKNKKKKKIRIAYFGDSMIEGDLITQDLRKMLQDYFGGSGVGFVPVTSIVAGFRQTVTHTFSSNWEDVNYISRNKVAAQLFLSGHSFFPGDNSTVTYRTVSKPRLDSFITATILY